METKKSKKADLKNNGVLFFEIGMAVSIAIVLVAFQWTTNDRLLANNLSENLTLNFEEEWLPIKTERDKPEQQQQQQAVEVIDIVEDTEDIDDIEILDTEGDMDTQVEIIAMDEELLDETDQNVFMIVETMPVYPGGSQALMRDIMSRVNYPEIAKETGTQGRVFVEFVVNKKGMVEKVRVVRGVDPSLDNEAVRVIKTLTGWTPGMQRGKAVNVSFTVPINFQLN